MRDVGQSGGSRAKETRMLWRSFIILLLGIMASLPKPGHAAAPPSMVGFEDIHLPDGSETGIWYPALGKPVSVNLGLWQQEVVPDAPPIGSGLKLIVISHGSGGSFAEHFDTAEALASHGFVVAALTHAGDNWQDQSRSTDVAKRPAELEALIDFMLTQWRFHAQLATSQIGAFGFSAGGFTVLATAGGRPDLSLMTAHCAAHPDFFDCRLLKAQPQASAAWPYVHDTRIKALVVAAPALGFTFNQAGLAAITMPVQLWRAGNDQVLPAPYYADAVRAALPRPPEFHVVPGAGHLDFVAPCMVGAPPIPVCQTAPGFDRARFHQDFNAEIVRFFSQHL
jgi:predicted dienelactone hydrolase